MVKNIRLKIVASVCDQWMWGVGVVARHGHQIDIE